MRLEDFLNFQIETNCMYNFLINKSRKEVGRVITGIALDGDKGKTKKIKWTEIRTVHLAKAALYTILYKYKFHVL